LQGATTNGESWSFLWSEEAVVRNLIAKFPDTVAERFEPVSNLSELQESVKANSTGENALSAQELAAITTVIAGVGPATDDAWTRIVGILRERQPKYFRFTQYSTLPGRIDFKELTNQAATGPASSSLQTARALLSLAGTDVAQLGSDTYELRKGELEAVQIDLTNQVFEYWKQNAALEVLIDVDKETVKQGNGTMAVSRFLDIRLRDKRTGYSNNFSQRSSGFQWFFSFLAAFSEFEAREAPIVLLDEPALTLHAKAQGDFLRFINERLAPKSPVLYTTHSPFMIEAGSLHRVRIVEDNGPPTGATCSDQVLASDPSSLFPLQAALGYDIAQTLFVGPNNLVVEGTSDFIYLKTMTPACIASGRTGLDRRWRVLPAGGATNIPTFVSLVGPHLDVTVLADSDTRGMQRFTNMITQKLLLAHRLILPNAVIGTKDADIEDIFAEEDYVALFNRTYGKSVSVAQLPPGTRIVKRLEALDGGFDHGDVAETLLKCCQEFSFREATLDRFAALFAAINKTMGA